MNSQFLAVLLLFCSINVLGKSSEESTIESEEICVSTEKLSGDKCHILSAEIEILSHTEFSLTENSSPLCPQWPRFNFTIGLYIESPGRFIFYGANGDEIGVLNRKPFKNDEFYGELNGYTFLKCKL